MSVGCRIVRVARWASAFWLLESEVLEVHPSHLVVWDMHQPVAWRSLPKQPVTVAHRERFAVVRSQDESPVVSYNALVMALESEQLAREHGTDDWPTLEEIEREFGYAEAGEGERVHQNEEGPAGAVAEHAGDSAPHAPAAAQAGG